MKSIINSIPRDKVYHFVAGLLIALIVGFIFGTTVGFMAAVVAGIGKEVFDHYKNKKEPGTATVDVLDAVVTILGGVVGSVFIQVAFNV
jgi:uncharacterized protein involved in cysteine biosynthesis